ncbi:zinc-dependent alcohol dehydrogenase family protein [Shewanella salipaludis]|uniref:Zinc-dependent alcohol dehydrogenase family protein n=1 Tax=Shewanella salipaludis TaxID=2723052 RepID=A0A972FUN4_9GAMM|nr:zinc-dependent alcohol dehydrogenase family protein [Shewanella salipaludis]NMH65629.1 zinc-dependent alcohol dehydrogenase family protein [Shewanella salipaludis]
MSESMKAVIAEHIDAPLKSVLLTIPTPKPGEVRVRVAASGVNPLDLKIRAGQAPHAKHPLPAVLGMDMAGIVDSVGSEVDQFKQGDRVFGLTGGIGGHQGALAEYQVVDAALLAKVPESMSLREAASIPLIFTTAWEGIVDRANVSEGQSVLVHGGAGGVGQMAVQIAKAYGAEVYATGKAQDAETIRNLGATPIDFERTSVEEYLNQYTGGAGFDIVYDTVGGTVLDSAFESVKNYTGHVVSCLGWGTHSLAPLSFRGATYSGVFTLMPLQTGKARAHHGHIMQQASKLVENSQLRVIQDPNKFDLSQVNEAHGHVMAGRAKGKVVITIADI